ncbi:MAG: hypothetical protein HKN09_09710 [Saprospiraceae bacterium]|nr:hypothetical protein [Saprospiraceae bacterium]
MKQIATSKLTVRNSLYNKGLAIYPCLYSLMILLFCSSPVSRLMAQPDVCGGPTIELFASDGQAPSTLFVLDPLTGSDTPIGPIGYDFVGALEYNDDTGYFYAIGRDPGDGTQVLMTIDLATGAGTLVGALSPQFTKGTGAPTFDMTYDADNGIMYVNSFFNPDCVVLAQINVNTAEVTDILPTLTCSPGNGMAYCDGSIYLYDVDNGGTLYTLDPVTGSGTGVANVSYTGFPLLIGPRINSMDCDASGNLYVDVNDGAVGSGPNYLGIMNRNTGEVSFIGQTINGLNGLAWGDSTPCASDCNIQCEDQINISLDQSCEAIITPAMGAIGLLPICNDSYTIEVFDSYGDPIPGNLVDLSHKDQMLEFVITEPCCGNSCDGKITVEYKLPPQIVCPPDTVLTCGILNVLGLPPAVGACADFEVFLANEQRDQLLCDPIYTYEITRTYKAVDEFGNEDECTQTIRLERLQLNDIVFPGPKSLATGNAISCSDPLYEFDMNGNPLPFPSDPMTGTGSGVPIVCDPNVTDGLFCPLTGSASGVPLVPGVFTGPNTGTPTQVGCSATVMYTDVEVPSIACIKKIMRIWEVREWWCNGESSQGGIQLIEVIDDEAPEFECPPDFSVTTNDDCAGSVVLPPISGTDNCNNGFNVRVDYPLGFIEGNGGTAELQVGVNTITYLVNDDCYNQSSCTMQVTVADDTEPVTVCEQDVNVNIGSTGMVEVFVNSFDDGSWDECGLDRVEVARMDTTCVPADTLFGESISFCCTDVGQELMIVMQAVDMGGNTNQCMIRVHVADNILPSMTCPSNMTIDCRESYDLNNLGATFGNPVITDNCAETQVVNEIATEDVNQCNIGEITRVFELMAPDGSVYQSCAQQIIVENQTPFVFANIQWPLNYEVTDGCSEADMIPQELPDNFNFPIYLAGDDECSLLGYDYQDTIVTPQGNECIRIERTWKVINWCSQSGGTFDVFEIPSPQIVTLVNDEAPVMDDADDLVFESDNIDCLSGDIEIERTATDDCPQPLNWTYSVTDDMLNVVDSGDTSIIEGVFTVGVYQILWTVSDQCGNVDSDTQTFEITNTKSPNPVCLSGLTFYVVPNMAMDNETVEVTTDMVDGGSFHTCNNPITLSMSSDTTIKSIIFDCDSLGIRTFQLWVTDNVNGAQDYCEAILMVEDTNSVNICPANSNLVDLGGSIYTETDDFVENVMVNLGHPDLSVPTTSYGEYAFNNMPIGGNYLVEPNKLDDPLNGISTLDLILIQRHVLGLERLSSPYKLLAADVDNSGDITARDMIELRRLILGVYRDFPENTSWRFVDAEHQFTDEYNPWFTDIPQDYAIQNLSSDMTINFVGIKTGDVNDSAIPNSTINEDDIDEVEMRLLVDMPAIQPGEIVEVPVYGDVYKDVLGWQASIALGQNNFEYLGIEAGLLDLDPEYNVHLSDDNILNISYHSKAAQSFEEDEPLFTLLLNAKSNHATKLDFDRRQMKAESYYSNGEIKALSIADKKLPQSSFDIVVSPNPWKESTVIELNAQEAQDLEVMFYDVSGRMIYSQSVPRFNGRMAIQLDRTQITSNGIIYIQVVGQNTSLNARMLVVD